MKVENDGNSAGTSGASYADASDGLWVDTRWNTATNTPFKVTSNSGTAPMMIIKGNGKVGIGTADPDEKLHVAGQASFEGAGNVNRGNIIIGAHGSGSAKWATLAATHYNDATGSASGTGGAGNMLIGGYSDASGNTVYIGGGPYELNPATGITFNTHSATTHNLGGTTRMTINSSGNIAMSGTLAVTGTLSSGTLTVNTDANSSLVIKDGGTNAIHIAAAAGDELYLGGNNTYALRFLNDGSNNVVFDNSSNVGIGTSAPTELLHIKNPSNAWNQYARIRIGTETSDNYASEIGFHRGTSSDADRGFFIDGGGGGTQHLKVLYTGKVGIGTATPGLTLEVNSASSSDIVKFGNNNGSFILGKTANLASIDLASDANLRIRHGSVQSLYLSSTGNVELGDGKPIVSETDVGTHFYTHLATGSFYQGSNQAVAINTNIPSHNVTGNNMFSISITGFSYDSTNGGIIDCNIGMYSGEGGFHNSSISGSNIPREWIGKIRVGYTSANKVVILLGDIDTSTNYELAVSCGVQGFYGVSSAFFTDWTMSAVTSLSAYGSTLATIHQKTTQMIGFESYSTGFSKSTGWSKVSDWGNGVEAYDFGGYLTSGRFTPLQPGMYQFSYGGWAAYNSSTGQERYAFAAAKNGGLQYLTGANYSAGDSPLGGGTRTVYLNGSSDYVELWMYSSVATTVGGSSHYMWWQGHLLGASNSGQSWAI